MKKATYKIIRTAAVKYYKSLKVSEVKQEFLKQGLLNQNAKLAKSKNGESNNWGLELVPSDLIGSFNFCGQETTCKFECLFFSGTQNILKSNSIIKGELSHAIKKRIRRAFLYLTDQGFFYSLLAQNITNKNEIAKLQGQKSEIRLNVFSDLDWTAFMDSLTEIKFYDYTKFWDRSSPSNCDITYSASERTTIKQIHEKINQGHNVAMVFNGKLPESYDGIEVIDGDLSDSRMNDKKGCIVGLKVKQTVKRKEDKNTFTNQY